MKKTIIYIFPLFILLWVSNFLVADQSRLVVSIRNIAEKLNKAEELKNKGDEGWKDIVINIIPKIDQLEWESDETDFKIIYPVLQAQTYYLLGWNNKALHLLQSIDSLVETWEKKKVPLKIDGEEVVVKAKFIYANIFFESPKNSKDIVPDSIQNSDIPGIKDLYFANLKRSYLATLKTYKTIQVKYPNYKYIKKVNENAESCKRVLREKFNINEEEIDRITQEKDHPQKKK